MVAVPVREESILCVAVYSWYTLYLLDLRRNALNRCFAGNPGLLGFYTDYLQRVYESNTNPGFAILAHGLLGHTPGLSTPSHLLGLRAQIDAILEIMDALLSSFGSELKIILVGHSVGSWLCLQVDSICNRESERLT